MGLPKKERPFYPATLTTRSGQLWSYILVARKQAINEFLVQPNAKMARGPQRQAKKEVERAKMKKKLMDCSSSVT